MVQILSIPETAYDSRAYLNVKSTSLIKYLWTIGKGSSFILVTAYLLGYFILKPLLEVGASRRLEVLDLYRAKLRDLYINLIGRVSHIPIVSFNKNKRQFDSVTQTTESSFSQSQIPSKDTLGQLALTQSLQKLTALLPSITPYSTELPHYSLTSASIKDLLSNVDKKYFNTTDFFSVSVQDKGKTIYRDIAVDTKNEIRGIKGLFMSGQA